MKLYEMFNLIIHFELLLLSQIYVIVLEIQIKLFKYKLTYLCNQLNLKPNESTKYLLLF